MRCKYCGTSKKSLRYVNVRRVGGGNYRRGSRTYHAWVCEPCGRELLGMEQEGHSYVGSDHFDVLSLRFAMQELEKQTEKEARDAKR